MSSFSNSRIRSLSSSTVVISSVKTLYSNKDGLVWSDERRVNKPQKQLKSLLNVHVCTVRHQLANSVSRYWVRSETQSSQKRMFHQFMILTNRFVWTNSIRNQNLNLLGCLLRLVRYIFPSKIFGDISNKYIAIWKPKYDVDLATAFLSHTYLQKTIYKISRWETLVDNINS